MTYAVFDGTCLVGPGTGIPRVTWEIIREAAKQVGPDKPLQRMAVATLPGGIHPVYELGGVEAFSLGISSRRFLYGRALLGRPNLVERMHPRPDAVYWCYEHSFTADFPGVRQVVAAHDMTCSHCPWTRNWKQRWLHRTSFKRLARSRCEILAPSENTKRDLTELAGISPQRIHVIPYAANERFKVVEDESLLAEVAERLGLAGKQFVLFVGSPSRHKNIRLAMQVVRDVRRRTGQPLYFVGAGRYVHRYEELLNELGFTAEDRKFVITPGHVAEEDLVPLYNLAWVFLFPSLYEGFGLPVLEAMGCGTPVVCANTSSIPEAAGDAAILLDPDRPEQWVDALSDLLGNDARHRELREAGLARNRQFSWRNTASLLLGLMTGGG